MQIKLVGIITKKTIEREFSFSSDVLVVVVVTALGVSMQFFGDHT